MKKLILLTLTALIVVGCNEKQLNGTYKALTYRTYIVDSCEYVGLATGHGIHIAHKGNCRFCKERRQKELEELVIKLKEK